MTPLPYRMTLSTLPHSRVLASSARVVLDRLLDADMS